MGVRPNSTRRRQPGLGSRHYALVLATITFNAVLLALAAAGGESRDVLYVLLLGAPPLLLLALRDRPRPFRAFAGLLGLVYVAWSAATFFIGGVLFAPAGVLLLCAAFCPSPVNSRLMSESSLTLHGQRSGDDRRS